ncbi:hypothetical protein BDZ90DRAFT_234491 [Jaminaea rosea]|uniref:Uncharacterized protein n=1 Tax=Jaminaea rosea TaxID=1569628 RepID=A0A316UHW8_9BASI|nr:hypothetical protein BDZ90DRAFT_234491 [Jaminaea rosea]PWN24862.1 hypothetical protein BDZ90DRAFT_234491 [Jaminaea rosea]
MPPFSNYLALSKGLVQGLASDGQTLVSDVYDQGTPCCADNLPARTRSARVDSPMGRLHGILQRLVVKAWLSRLSTSPSCRSGPICHLLSYGRPPTLDPPNFTVPCTFQARLAIIPLSLQPTTAHIATMQLQTAMLSTLLITLVAFIALGLAATVPLDSVDTRTLSITNRSSSIEVERRFIPSTTPKACLGTNIFCLTYVGSEVHVESSAVSLAVFSLACTASS